MCEKMGCGGDPDPDKLPAPTMVSASEGSLLGREDETLPFDSDPPAPGKVTSEASTPGRAAPSELSAGLGVAEELSPLDTAIPSCARRAPPSLSPAMSPLPR